jgi:hypothetical protein
MDEKELGDYSAICRLGVEAAVGINACLMKDSLTKRTAIELLSRSLREYAERIRSCGLDPDYDEIFKVVFEEYSGNPILGNADEVSKVVDGAATNLEVVICLPREEKERLISLCCDLSDLAGNVNFKKKDHSERDVA